MPIYGLYQFTRQIESNRCEIVQDCAEIQPSHNALQTSKMRRLCVVGPWHRIVRGRMINTKYSQRVRLWPVRYPDIVLAFQCTP